MNLLSLVYSRCIFTDPQWGAFLFTHIRYPQFLWLCLLTFLWIFSSVEINMAAALVQTSSTPCNFQTIVHFFVLLFLLLLFAVCWFLLCPAVLVTIWELSTLLASIYCIDWRRRRRRTRTRRRRILVKWVIKRKKGKNERKQRSVRKGKKKENCELKWGL